MIVGMDWLWWGFRMEWGVLWKCRACCVSRGDWPFRRAIGQVFDRCLLEQVFRSRSITVGVQVYDGKYSGLPLGYE